MNELIKLVSEKAGIPYATAKVAVETVIKFLKEKLPAPMADRLDDIIEGVDKVNNPQINNIAKGLGGLFKK